MTELNEIYKCNICGNIIEMVHSGKGELVCCGQPMELQKEKTKEEGNEKHLPVIEKTEKGIKVTIGLTCNPEAPENSTCHPMEENHFIEWVELITKDGRIGKRYLKLGQTPVAEFDLTTADIKSARAYCNLHGLWKQEKY